MKSNWTHATRPADVPQRRVAGDQLADALRVMSATDLRHLPTDLLHRVVASVDRRGMPADLRRVLRALPRPKRKNGRPGRWTDVELGLLLFAVFMVRQATGCSERKACAKVARMKSYAHLGYDTVWRRLDDAKRSPRLINADALAQIYAAMMK